MMQLCRSDELAAPPLVRKENFKIYRLTGYKLAAAGAYRYHTKVWDLGRTPCGRNDISVLEN